MSAQVLNRFEWAKAVNRSDLLDRAKTVAWALAVEFCNDETGRLDPSLKTLAEATGKTVDTVKRAIRDLTTSGWLARTEGRGRGNKTEYTLLSPGKVIAISSAKTGAPTHHEKGGTGAPLTREKGAPVHRAKGGTGAPLTKEKGAPVHGKGGTGALSYNKDKQTYEQKGRACPARSLRIIHATDAEKVASWNAWLSENGFPSLQQLTALKGGDSHGPGYLMPRLWVPSCDEDQAMIREFVLWAVDCEEVRYAAQ